ncbi:hypothetical protein B0T10DRAFT_416006 [Thelonectria olida]|uniref:Uncharacterized protein n=1 Tax=Thelonectria olida TaxID=1576542 RepID=A0A9P8VUT1_9HYPO|nr:hypothetical protein B0T10DRAFT_416006 [Thelonectria olida]
MADAPSSHELKPTSPARLTLEAWSQGFMVGALVIMAAITLANMRRGVLLHKLILIELVLALPNGYFTFFEPPVWGWYLSSTAVLLITSWTMHNIIAWMKNKPFLPPRGNLIYIGTIILAQPYWVLELYANFTYYNGINSRLFVSTRPFEALCRDPWWVFTTANLFWNVKYRYEFGFIEIVRVSPRFGILLLSMCLSLIFITIDIFSVTPVLAIGGINPFWKFSLVFKCLTDTIILDDFKTALDKLSRHKMNQIYTLPFSFRNSDLGPQRIPMDRRGEEVIPCNESDVMVSIEQIEEIPVGADLGISTARALPYPPPIASTPVSMDAVRKGDGGKKGLTVSKSLCAKCASSL